MAFVQFAVLSEAERAMDYRGARKMHFQSLVDYGSMERLKTTSIRDARKNAEQNRIVWYVHDGLPMKG